MACLFRGICVRGKTEKRKPCDPYRDMSNEVPRHDKAHGHHREELWNNRRLVDARGPFVMIL